MVRDHRRLGNPLIRSVRTPHTILVEKYRPRSGGGGWYFALESLEHFDRLVDECESFRVVFLGKWRPMEALLDEAVIRKVAKDQAIGLDGAFVGFKSFFPQELDASYPQDELDISECVEEYGGRKGWHGHTLRFPSRYWE